MQGNHLTPGTLCSPILLNSKKLIIELTIQKSSSSKTFLSFLKNSLEQESFLLVAKADQALSLEIHILILILLLTQHCLSLIVSSGHCSIIIIILLKGFSSPQRI